MIKQAENEVKIVGVLSESNLEYKDFSKSGVVRRAIVGSITVKSKIGDKEVEIPVQVFSYKEKNDGTPNTVFNNWVDVKENYLSIGAVGIEKADGIQLDRASLSWNDYYGRNGNLISFPRIRASFVKKITRLEATEKAEASFIVCGVVANIGRTAEDKVFVKMVVPQYGGEVDVMTFYALNENVGSAIESNWAPDQTVKANGWLDFTSKTETYSTSEEGSGFGTPAVKERTINISDLLIIGGSDPYDDEMAYDINEIQTAVIAKKAKIEASKEKSTAKAAPAAKASTLSALGF